MNNVTQQCTVLYTSQLINKTMPILKCILAKIDPGVVPDFGGRLPPSFMILSTFLPHFFHVVSSACEVEMYTHAPHYT